MTGVNIDLNLGKRGNIDVVYNFIFEKDDELDHSTVLVNGVPALVLGHGLKDNKVVDHAYFGSYEKVSRDLEAMQGFTEGVVVLKAETCCVKSMASGLVDRMIQSLDEKAIVIETNEQKRTQVSPLKRRSSSKESCFIDIDSNSSNSNSFKKKLTIMNFSEDESTEDVFSRSYSEEELEKELKRLKTAPAHLKKTVTLFNKNFYEIFTIDENKSITGCSHSETEDISTASESPIEKYGMKKKCMTTTNARQTSKKVNLHKVKKENGKGNGIPFHTPLIMVK